jgi:hypothetical protein
VSRAILPKVSDYYQPQIQLCMEICDIDKCYFVQYRPESLWNPEEFIKLEVKRDRNWFATILPTAHEFWKRVLYHRANGAVELIRKMESRKRPRSEGREIVIEHVPCNIVPTEGDQGDHMEPPSVCMIEMSLED